MTDKVNNIAFSICANNYLAHAKTLARSFKKLNPNVTFITVVVDEKSELIDYDELAADEVVFITEIIAEKVVLELGDKFNITELCTVVKPDVLLHLEKKGYEKVAYLDPDIEVFSELNEVFDKLDEHNMFITPHICSPTKQDVSPSDYHLLRTGVYNLGFGAFNLKKTLPFISWWKERVLEYGYRVDAKGMFYDQIWMSYAPSFDSTTHISHDLGYNVANWNLHERKLVKKNDVFYVNDETCKLKFFHFSHFKIEDLPSIAKYNNQFTLENRKDITSLFKNYAQLLELNGYHQLKNIKYKYGVQIDIRENQDNRNKLVVKFRKSGGLIKRAIKVWL